MSKMYSNLYNELFNELTRCNNKRELSEVSEKIYEHFKNDNLTDYEFAKLNDVYENLTPGSKTVSDSKRSLKDSLDFLMDSNYKYKKHNIKKSGKFYLVLDEGGHQIAKFNTAAEAESYVDNLSKMGI